MGMRTEVRIGKGKDLSHYKTTSFEETNIDLTAILPNGDEVELITRSQGYVLRIMEGRTTTTLRDFDYK